MGNLYDVMDEFLKVEDELNALKSVSLLLYNNCCTNNSENADLKATLCLTSKYIESLSADLHHSIGELDKFIVKEK